MCQYKAVPGTDKIIQFEECIGDLQHQDMRVVMLMADEYTLASSSHAMLFVMFF